MKKVLYVKYDDGYFFHLTIDKWYEIMEENENFYKIFCDMEFSYYFNKKLFLTEKEQRKLKLEKLNESM